MRRSFWRALALAATAAIIPACDESTTTVITNALTSPDASIPASATGATTDDDTIAGSAVGADNEPRLVFLRTQAGTNDLRFTRRNSDGTWTTPLILSGTNAAAKTAVQVEHTPNGMTHILWLEGTAVHYARVNNATPPAIDLADTIISATEPSNVTAGATLGAVTALAAASSPAGGNVFIVWIQSIDDDAGAGGVADVVPVAAVVAGGSGAAGEHFALVAPNTDGAGATASTPVARTDPNGNGHAAWFGTDAAAATPELRHRQRTGTATWSSGPDGDVVSEGQSTGFGFVDLLFAADGDAYAVWVRTGPDRPVAAYRAAGAGSTFATPSPSTPSYIAGFSLGAAALEPNTEFLHVMYEIAGAGIGTVRHTAANLGGTWVSSSTAIGGVLAGSSRIWTDSTDRSVLVTQFASETQVRIRTTGTTPWTTSWTSRTLAVTHADLEVASNSLGDTIIAWREGETSAAPFGEILSVKYTSGGTLGGTRNISGTAGVGSHAVVPFLTDLGSEHYLWQETTLTAPDAHDIFYSRHN